MIVLYMVSYLTMVGKVFERQIFLDSTVKKISKAAFYLELADKLSEHNDTLKEKKENVGELFDEIEEMGISLTDQFYKDGMVDINLNYNVNTFFWNHSIQVKQRARMRDWRGVDIAESEDYVYITKTGTVYHNSRNCRYLNIKLKNVKFNTVGLLRNENGAKYSACDICVKQKLDIGTDVYVTTDGNRYHTDMNCSGIIRYVITINQKDVGDRKPCSVCGG